MNHNRLSGRESYPTVGEPYAFDAEMLATQDTQAALLDLIAILYATANGRSRLSDFRTVK